MCSSVCTTSAFCDTHVQYPWHTFFFNLETITVSFFPIGITDSWQTGCTHPCSRALERDSEGNTFLKSTYSSLSLSSLGYLDFNYALFVFFTLISFSKYFALLPVCWLMLIRSFYHSVFIFTTHFCEKLRTQFFFFLGHLSLRHAAADYVIKFIPICKIWLYW